MAQEGLLRTWPFTAGEDLSSTGQYRFVSAATSDGYVYLSTGIGGRVLGVLQNNPSSGYDAAVALPGSITKINTDGSIGLAESVACSSVGRGQASTAGSYVLGQIITGSSGSAGDILTMLLQTPATT